MRAIISPRKYGDGGILRVWCLILEASTVDLSMHGGKRLITCSQIDETQVGSAHLVFISNLDIFANLRVGGC